MSYKKPGYYTLYKISFPNGKVYIGITSRFLQDRIKQHILPSQNKHKRPVYRALKKYDNLVKCETILTFDKKEDVQSAEVAFIQFYHSTNPNYGYNLSFGGESNHGFKRTDNLQKIIDNCGNIFNGYEEAMSYYSFSRAQVRSSIVQNCYSGHVYFSLYKEGMTVAEPRNVGKRYHRKVIDHKNQITFLSVKAAAEYHNIPGAKITHLCLKNKRNKLFSYMDEV